MTVLSEDEFRCALLEKYEALASSRSPAAMRYDLQEMLRPLFVRILDQATALESRAIAFRIDESEALSPIDDSALDALVESCQQSLLALPRVTCDTGFNEFYEEMRRRYDAPLKTVAKEDLVEALDRDTNPVHSSLYDLTFQLHYIADELGRSRDSDLGEQTDMMLGQVVELWQHVLRTLPRVVVATGDETS